MSLFSTEILRFRNRIHAQRTPRSFPHPQRERSNARRTINSFPKRRSPTNQFLRITSTHPATPSCPSLHLRPLGILRRTSDRPDRRPLLSLSDTFVRQSIAPTSFQTSLDQSSSCWIDGAVRRGGADESVEDATEERSFVGMMAELSIREKRMQNSKIGVLELCEGGSAIWSRF